MVDEGDGPEIMAGVVVSGREFAREFGQGRSGGRRTPFGRRYIPDMDNWINHQMTIFIGSMLLGSLFF